MKQKTAKNFTYWLEVAAIGVVLGLVLQGARAWIEPSEAPPGGNLGAPINTSGNTQVKGGSLGINSDGNPVGLLVGGNTGIGTTAPNTLAPNSQPGNLDVNDIYLRSIGQWASQSLRSYALLEYRVSGACGGTAQPPGWGWHNIRLNRETQDANNIVTLLPNSEFTLAEGTYRINAFVLFHPGSHRAKLCYAGDESVVLLGSNPEVGASNILGQFTLADTTTLKIMDYFPAGGECDFGYSSFDRYTDESIFTQVEIWKI